MAVTLSAVLLAVCVVVPPALAEEAKPAEEVKIAKAVGDEVPAWSAKTLDSGETVASSGFKGKPYALVFVNSSCSACRGELSALSRMEFGDNLDVIVAAIDMKPERTLATYRDGMKLTNTLLDDSSRALSELFDFSYTPATVIVKDGKVDFRFGGYSSKHKAKLLGEFEKYAK